MQERIINPDLLQKAVQTLSHHFSTKLEIEDPVEFISEPERRNIILRLKIRNHSGNLPKSVILKQSLPELSDADDKEAQARFARDWAGLEFANSIRQRTHNVPLFYGGNKEFRFILIEDLGRRHISLVDSLTLPCRDKAVSALKRFVKALGSFHAASFGQTALYERILSRIHQETDTHQDDLQFFLTELPEKLMSAHNKLNLSLSVECLTEVKGLIESLLKPGPFTVLTHGDICPDNVFDHEDTRDLQLIDFEWTFVRNALLDGTYLRMTMPTCWCAKAIPDDVIDSLELIYRAELKRTIPAARDDLAYARAYTEACGFWVLQQTIPHLDSILNNDRVGCSGPVPENSLWKPEENGVRPRFLSRLQAFIDVAVRHDLLPHSRQMAANVLYEVKQRWPDPKIP